MCEPLRDARIPVESGHAFESVLAMRIERVGAPILVGRRWSIGMRPGSPLSEASGNGNGHGLVRVGRTLRRAGESLREIRVMLGGVPRQVT